MVLQRGRDPPADPARWMPSKVRIGRAGPMVLPCKFGIANALRARYWLSSGATLNAQGGSIGVQSGTVSFWGMQCEIGYITTVLEKPAPDFELAQCMRWYQSHVGILVLAPRRLAATW